MSSTNVRMQSQDNIFVYDPSKVGYETTVLHAHTGTPSISSSKLRLTSAGVQTYEDFQFGHLAMVFNIPTTPSGTEAKQWGFKSSGFGTRGSAYFDIAATVFSCKSYDDNGTAESTTVAWTSGWENAATEYRIIWTPEVIRFYVADTLVATHKTRIGFTPQSIYFNNADADNCDLSYVSLVNIGKRATAANKMDVDVTMSSLTSAANTARTTATLVLPTQNIGADGTVSPTGSLNTNAPFVKLTDGTSNLTLGTGTTKNVPVGLNDGTTAIVFGTGTQKTVPCALSDGTTEVDVVATINSLKSDLSSVAGTATVTAGVNGLQAVGGNAASGATDSGNPLKTGGKYNTTLPTLTDGQRGDTQLDVRANTIVTLGTGLNQTDDSVSAYIGASSTVTGFNTLFDSDGDNTAQALTVNGSNLYHVHVYNPNAAVAFVQLFDLATASVTVGTTAPKYVIFVPATGNTVEDFDVPMSFTTAATYACTTTATGNGDPTVGLTVSFGYKN
jgi:hypothetical protein